MMVFGKIAFITSPEEIEEQLKTGKGAFVCFIALPTKPI